MSAQFDAFASTMGARVGQIEKWLERLTESVERLSENRERIVAIETRAQFAHENNERRIGKLEHDLATVKSTVIRLTMIASGATGLAAIVASIIAKMVLGA